MFYWVNKPVISHWISHRFSHCHITLHCYSWCLLRVASPLPLTSPLTSQLNSFLYFSINCSSLLRSSLSFLFELHLNFSRVSHTFLCSREGRATTVRKKVRSKKSAEEVCEEEELRNWSSRILAQNQSNTKKKCRQSICFDSEWATVWNGDMREKEQGIIEIGNIHWLDSMWDYWLDLSQWSTVLSSIEGCG